MRNGSCSSQRKSMDPVLAFHPAAHGISCFVACRVSRSPHSILRPARRRAIGARRQEKTGLWPAGYLRHARGVFDPFQPQSHGCRISPKSVGGTCFPYLHLILTTQLHYLLCKTASFRCALFPWFGCATGRFLRRSLRTCLEHGAQRLDCHSDFLQISACRHLEIALVPGAAACAVDEP